MNQKDLDDPNQLPGEIAGLVLWLASPARDHASGSNFTLDGGVMQSGWSERNR
ncbi:MAG: hypothetical protein M3154_08265 [Candidatus Eremiobacteraeota bacterium]|nr:hypothetical protein [Candidatus Eremiobacteraeota bacterium]